MEAGYKKKLSNGRTLYTVCIKTPEILQKEKEQAEKDYYNENKTKPSADKAA